MASHDDPPDGRRAHLAKLSALLGAALFPGLALAQDRAVRPAALERAEALSFALARARIEPEAWQSMIEDALRATPPARLLEHLDVDAMRRRTPHAERGAAVVRLPTAFGAVPAGRRRVSVKLFFLDRGRANPPHAHDHMVSAHLVLRGRFRFRHFERVRDEPGAIVVRPSIDRVLGPGELTSVSDHRDNVHWHVAQSDGVLLDVLVSRLHPSAPTGRHLLDIDGGAPVEGGTRAPILTRARALARYG